MSIDLEIKNIVLKYYPDVIKWSSSICTLTIKMHVIDHNEHCIMEGVARLLKTHAERKFFYWYYNEYCRMHLYYDLHYTLGDTVDNFYNFLVKAVHISIDKEKVNQYTR